MVCALLASGPRQQNSDPLDNTRHCSYPMRLIFILVGLAFAPALASAQSAGPYQFPLGDTLRYHEVTRSETVIEAPQGAIPVLSEYDGIIGLAGSGEERVRAWFESLRLRAVGPNGDQSPATTELLRKPYELTMSPRGSVDVLATPTFPEPVAAITDLSHQFFDFFAVMPASPPVTGTVWQDTIRSESATAPGTSQFNESIRHFEFRADTVVNGVPAMVIVVSAEVRTEGSAPMEGQPLTVSTSLKGTDTGFLIFDWAAGRLLHRSRSGEMSGVFRILGAPQPVEFPQTSTYSSTIDLLR